MRLPIAALLLIAANITAAFVLVFQPELSESMGFDPANPSLQDALGSLFLHSNLFHLSANMLFLAAVGPSVELSTGSIRFVVVYFFAGLLGVAAHWIFAGQATPPPILIGASSAVAGCLAYYSVRYSKLQVPLAPGLGAPVVGIAAFWVVLQALGGWIGGQGTAYWSHVGGFVAGLGLSLLYHAPSLAVVEERAKSLREAGRRSAGAALVTSDRALAQNPADPEALRAKIAALRRLGDKDEEAEALLALLDADPDCDHAAVMGRLVQIGYGASVSSHRRLACGEAALQGDPELARLLLESVADGPEDDTARPEALLSLAGLEMESDPVSAKRWLDRLMADYPLHPAAEVAQRRGWTA